MNITNNFDGRIAAIPINYFPTCFVQEYVRQNANFLNSLIVGFESKAKVRKYFANPTISEAGLLGDNRNHFDQSDVLLFDEEYPSPVYNLLGKRMFVRAFCLQNYKEL